MAITTIDGPPTVRADIGELAGRAKDTLTVLFVDAISAAADRNAEAGVKDHRQFEEINRLILRHQGTVVRTIGNSLMVEFSGPVLAVRAGIEIERLLQPLNATFPQDQQLELRIGIHASAGTSQGIDAFGEVVNGAAGITKRAAAGQILISRSVYETVSQESDMHCRWLGNSPIDGRSEAEEIYEVSWAEAPANIPARYEVLSHIGTGGMGMVYKVRDQQTNEIVALKVLKPGMDSDPAMQESLRREVCLARKVTHKNVCRIHEFNRSNGTAFISMEFIEGESLSCRLRRSGRLPAHEALEITRQICDGLREAHAQGIIHRDLKPANIIVDRNGNVRIMDFGIARRVQDESQMTGTMAGTPAYMAPEQVSLKHVDARTDIYAVGLLLYEMFTGSPAFAGDNPIAVAVKQLRERPTPPREIVPELAAHMEAIILKCLEKDPDKRPQSVDELELALKKQAETKPSAEWWASVRPELQRMSSEFAQALQLRMQQAKPVLDRYASKSRQTSVELLLLARDAARRTKTYLEQQDWLAIVATRPQQALAGLGLVLVLGCAITFALGRSGNSNKNSAALDQTSSALAVQTYGPSSLPSSSLQETNTDGAPSATTASAGDLNRSSGPPSAKASSVRVNPAQGAAPRSRSANVRQSRLAVASPVVNITTVTATNDLQTAEVKLDTSIVAPEATPVETTNATKPAVDAPAASLEYLEVGSSKDAAWADSAVEKLSELGFHAVSKRKAHLWVQAYHVEVGPYTDPKDIDAARQNLAAHGFKSHVVK